MRNARDPALNTAIKAAVLLLCAGALVLIVITVSGVHGHSTTARLMGNALVIVFFLLMATSGATLARRRPGLAWFGYLTVAASLAALVGATVATWGGVHGGAWGKAIGIAGVLSLAGAHASLLLGPRYRDAGSRVQSLRNVTLALLAGVVSFVIYAIASSGDSVNGKLFVVLGILYALGALVLPLASRGSPATETPAPQGISPVDLLREHGLELLGGPVDRDGVHGPGRSVSLRQADGSLVELITYGPE